MIWNHNNHSLEENLRWIQLRSIEWDAWPFFVSQPLVPLAIYFFEWWKVIGALFLIQVMWTAIVRSHVSVVLAGIAPLVVRTKWILCPLMAYILYIHGHITLALLAILWPLLMNIIMFPVWIILKFTLTPFGIKVGDLGGIEQSFLRKLDYLASER